MGVTTNPTEPCELYNKYNWTLWIIQQVQLDLGRFTTGWSLDSRSTISKLCERAEEEVHFFSFSSTVFSFSRKRKNEKWL